MSSEKIKAAMMKVITMNEKAERYMSCYLVYL